MEDNWKSLEETQIDSSINQIHCDTRDFHCITHTEFLNTKDGNNRQITKYYHNYEYQIKENDIIDWLKYLKKISNGDGDWRMLSFYNVHDNNWLKYIRFYRVPKTNMFIVCNRDMLPIQYSNCTLNNLKTEHLNFSKN